MFYFTLSIIVFKNLINKIIIKKKKFNSNIYLLNNESHQLFRSAFCFFISTLSIVFSIIYWEYLISNSIETILLSTIINKLMFSYMLVDTLYICYDYYNKNNLRLELVLHHLVCLCLYGIFWDKAILSFCSSAEILSAYNWVGILFPQYEWTVKIFRLYSIILIRFFIWIFTLVFLRNYNYLFWFGFIFIMIFISLDCYWVWIIISNYTKYKTFIVDKIKKNSKKKFKKNF